jgi:peroxiredoxin
MWNRARAGQLEVGDPAPDFALGALDNRGKPVGDGRVRLSSFRGQPVVLVFGSYT